MGYEFTHCAGGRLSVHPSQVDTSEGSEDSVPSWRLEQIRMKSEQADADEQEAEEDGEEASCARATAAY